MIKYLNVQTVFIQRGTENSATGKSLFLRQQGIIYCETMHTYACGKAESGPKNPQNMPRHTVTPYS